MDTIKLNPPKLDKGVPVMQALKERKTGRDISSQKLSLQHLSEILWAADGLTHDQHKRTAPSAIALYPVEVFVVLESGVYLYDPAEHHLAPVAEGDFRKEAGRQDFVHAAPLNLVFVGNFDKLQNLPAWAATITRENKLKWMHLEAGHKVENVYIYCASENLRTVVRGVYDEEKLGTALKLGPHQVVLCAQTVGNPA